VPREANDTNKEKEAAKQNVTENNLATSHSDVKSMSETSDTNEKQSQDNNNEKKSSSLPQKDTEVNNNKTNQENDIKQVQQTEKVPTESKVLPPSISFHLSSFIPSSFVFSLSISISISSSSLEHVYLWHSRFLISFHFISFFSSNLIEHIKSAPKPIPVVPEAVTLTKKRAKSFYQYKEYSDDEESEEEEDDNILNKSNSVCGNTN
jgi:hypothetical protein